MITPIAQKFKVFDNFISPTYQDVIEQLLLSPEIPWNWQDTMDYKTGDIRGGGYPQFTVNVFEDDKKPIMSMSKYDYRNNKFLEHYICDVQVANIY